MTNITSNQTYNSSHLLLEPLSTWYWVVRGIIAILATAGNGLVIYFIVFKRRLHVTNNWFVLSLAIADFCIGFFTTLSGLACTFQFRCDWRLQTTFYNFLLFASTLNLWAMAIDRYMAIVYSLRYQSLMTNLVVIVMITLSWTVSFLAAFLRLIWFYSDYLRLKIDKYYQECVDILFGVSNGHLSSYFVYFKGARKTSLPAIGSAQLQSSLS